MNSISAISIKKWKEEYLSKLDENNILIDVRSKEEYKNGFIEGSINIDIQDPYFESAIDKLDINKRYFIYCGSGNRSLIACYKMQSLGFKDLYNLEGGISNWDGDIVSN